MVHVSIVASIIDGSWWLIMVHDDSIMIVIMVNSLIFNSDNNR